MDSNQPAEGDIRNFINGSRLIFRWVTGAVFLHECFKRQPTRLVRTPAEKLGMPLIIIARRHPTTMELIPATAVEDHGFPKLDGDVYTGPHSDRPIEWWIDRRFGEPIVSFRLEASPAELSVLYGPSIREIAGNRQAVEVVVENYLSNRWSRIRKPLFDPLPGEEPRPLILIKQFRFDNGFDAPPTEIVATLTVPNDWPDPDFHVIDDDIDLSPPGPVYWRTELRGSEQVSCSRGQCIRKGILRTFGKEITQFISRNDSVPLFLESYLSDSWKSIRTPIRPSQVLPKTSAADWELAQRLGTARSRGDSSLRIDDRRN